MNPVTLPAAWAHQQQPDSRAQVRHAGAPDDAAATHWNLQRRCAQTPAQFGACFAALATVCVLVAGFFWAMGAHVVSWFAGLEVVLVGLAFALHAVHAADGERLRVAEGCLHIERHQGVHVEHERIPLPGLRVALADRSIELNRRGQRWVLGRQATEAARRQALAGLRRAVAAVNG